MSSMLDKIKDQKLFETRKYLNRIATVSSNERVFIWKKRNVVGSTQQIL